MGRLFGTDGVRGLANGDLTPELALGLAASAAHVLVERSTRARPVAVVGRDTRASGEMLEAAVVAGLTSAGADVLRAGVLPTPAVAYLTAALGADLGVMLSASHNPMPDNGVKLFDAAGFKLGDDVEDAVEAGLGVAFDRPTGAGVGRVRDVEDAGERYVSHLVSRVGEGALAGLKVVVDCANGAAAYAAPEALSRAGAEVTAICALPDGLNINDGCGSTHPEALRDAVRALGADAGIAHDGDADRCLAVAADGTLVDGDAILAVCAVAMRENGRLAGDAVVTTVMANLGFKHAMADNGIRVVETPVGDRYVLEAMREHGLSVGGEQSGHVIFLDDASTGDGVLTALRLLSCVAARKQPLADLAAVMRRYPQVLLNVPAPGKDRLAEAGGVAEAVARAQADLGDEGRILVRPSGTEPVVRVMVEAGDEATARAVAERVAAVVARDLG